MTLNLNIPRWGFVPKFLLHHIITAFTNWRSWIMDMEEVGESSVMDTKIRKVGDINK
jgi:hypothetical protein